jgi:CBS domain containing-hemolysin-like protein
MISIDSVLDRINIREIYTTGHSRIPVFEGTRDNILGVLLVKVIILYLKKKLFIINTFLFITIHFFYCLVFDNAEPRRAKTSERI